MTRLLSRSAENLFWLARYIERAENLARILDVQETFARDSGGRQDWRMVLVINADTEAFFKRHTEASSANVLRFYVIERTNPTSIFSAVHAARENARALRPLISTEMWTQLNMLYNRLLALKPSGRGGGEALGPVRLDQARLRRPHRHHRRHVLPRRRLVLLPAGRRDRVRRPDHPPARRQVPELHGAGATSDPGSAVDSFYWMALLRSAAGYQAFRRRHPRGMAPEQVAAFLLSDPSFPRSVACCLGIIDEQLTVLRRCYGLRAAGAALRVPGRDPRRSRGAQGQGGDRQWRAAPLRRLPAA